MSIQFPCPSCGTQLTAPDSAAGKVGKCKGCGASALVPSSSVVPSQPARPLTAETSAATSKKPIPRATERQKEYARSLGVAFPDDINVRDMSALIDAATEKQDEERWRKLDELSDKESAAYAQMRQEVLADIDAEDCRLSAATPEQMTEALENRGLAAILITYAAGQTVPTGAQVNSTSDLNEEDLAKSLLLLAHSAVGRTNPALAKALATFFEKLA